MHVVNYVSNTVQSGVSANREQWEWLSIVIGSVCGVMVAKPTKLASGIPDVMQLVWTIVCALVVAHGKQKKP